MEAKPLLVVSVLANVVLLGTVGIFLTNRTPAENTPVVRRENPTNTHTILQRPGQRIITVTNSLEQKFDWRAVESADYKEYIANLRSIGCPEETIRDIIIADVNKLFESRKKALPAKKFEFWKTGNMFTSLVDEELVEKKQALAKEKKALLKELLGIEVDEPVDMASVTNPMLGMLDFLSDDKQSKVSELMQSFQAKMMKSFGNGGPDAEDMKNIMKMQREFDAELSKVLTPQEFEDYQLRLSQTAMMMRMQLGTFEPSEQEFREIFKLRKTFEDEYGWFGSAAMTAEEREQKSAAEKALKEQLKSMLGDSRYEEYIRAQDWKYQRIAKITERNGLGRDAANQVFEMNKLADEEIRKLRSDKNLDATKRDELIKAIKDETQNSIKGVLGEKAYESYKETPGFGF